jgi:hypothetical protein
MDHEFMVYSDESLYPVLPYVDFRFSKENVIDSSLVRIEHIWASPDQNSIGNGIFELSNTHYYLVDGLWDDGDFYSGRVNYNGSQETDLDYALYNSGEQQAVLVYRENSSQPWEIYSDFTLGTGSLTNGDGNFVIDTLRRGQYAFANGDITAGLQLQSETSLSPLNCFPNPATTELQVSGKFEGNEVALFDVYAANGRFVQRSSARINGAFIKRIDTSSLGSGIYFVQVSLADGRVLGVERVIVE